MGLKTNVGVKHVWTAGTTDELDKLVMGYLNDGWQLLDAKTTVADRFNHVMEMVYVFVKNESVAKTLVDVTEKVKV